MKSVKSKIISALIAIVLIIIVGIIAFGGRIKKSLENGETINGRWFLALIYPDKYAYSTEKADYNEYFGNFSADDVAIVLQDEIIEDKARVINGVTYFSLDTVSNLLTDRFYYNQAEKVLLYTTSTDIIKVNIDEESGYYVSGEAVSTDYDPAYIEGDTLYVAADYVRSYANFQYETFADPGRVQLYTSWGEVRVATVAKNTKVRVKGGIKSSILTSVSKDDEVIVLEQMEKWTKIKSGDCFIGYVEKDCLNEESVKTLQPVNDAYSPEADYGTNTNPEKVVLAWHQLYYADDGAGLNELTENATNLNVVSPTWYYINSAEGTFDDYSSAAYVENAHEHGYKVWALVEDMTNDFDEEALFLNSANRKAFIDNLIASVTAAGADGINIDCERIGNVTGPHYVQFLRELAIETRKHGLTLSVDNYQQNEGNLYYNLKEQGLVADYVIIMGYDEHWSGCSEAGSVASIGFVENGVTGALNAGVPKEKLINGVPFYTRLWKTEGVNVTSQALGMSEAQAWLDEHAITPLWDEETCQYTASREDGTALYEIWLEEPKSLEAKMSVMQKYDIAGVACWKLGFEYPEIWQSIALYY